MKFRRYVVVMRHDRGTARFVTVARNMGAAAHIVCEAERAPRRAVVSVRRDEPKVRRPRR